MRVRKPLPASELSAHHRSAILEARKLRATKRPRALYPLSVSASRNTARGGRRKHKFVVDLEPGKLYHRGINRRNCVCIESWKSLAGSLGAERRCAVQTQGDDWDLIHACCTHPLGASFGATWSR